MSLETEFLQHTKAVKYTEPHTNKRITPCYIDEKNRIAKWVIHSKAQRLWKWDAIAKDALICDVLIFPYTDTIEVLDLTDSSICSITVSGFKENYWLLSKGAGEQYAVDRKHWEKRTLYAE